MGKCFKLPGSAAPWFCSAQMYFTDEMMVLLFALFFLCRFYQRVRSRRYHSKSYISMQRILLTLSFLLDVST